MTNPEQDALAKELDAILSFYPLMPAQKARLIERLIRLFLGTHRCSCGLCQIDEKT
jgi:hypothetical protein